MRVVFNDEDHEFECNEEVLRGPAKQYTLLRANLASALRKISDGAKHPHVRVWNGKLAAFNTIRIILTDNNLQIGCQDFLDSNRDALVAWALEYREEE